MTLSIRLYLAGCALSNPAVTPNGPQGFDQSFVGESVQNALRLADALCEAAEVDGSADAFPASGGVTVVAGGPAGAFPAPGQPPVSTSGAMPPPKPKVKTMAVAIVINGHQRQEPVMVPETATRKEIEEVICDKLPFLDEKNRSQYIVWKYDEEAHVMSLSFSQGLPLEQNYRLTEMTFARIDGA